MLSIEERIAQDIAAKTEQVRAAVELLDEGATVPFIARYRKEVTGGLDDIQLRLLEERLRYLRELEDRRAAICPEHRGAGQDDRRPARRCRSPPTPRRAWKTSTCPSNRSAAPRRRSPAKPAWSRWRSACVSDPTQDPETFAAGFVDAEKGVADAKAALDGARAILMERWPRTPAWSANCATGCGKRRQIAARVVPGKETEGAKFRDYFEHSESIAKIPSHRLLALMRARNEGVLDLDLATRAPTPTRAMPRARAALPPAPASSTASAAADAWLRETVRLTWRVKLHLHLTAGPVRPRARKRRRRGDPRVRRQPQGPDAGRAGRRKTVMGLDPGIRTGARSPWSTPPASWSPPIRSTRTSRATSGTSRSQRIAVLARQHDVDLIAIGNGTASRETDKLVGEVIKKHAELKLPKIVVSEAGASVYSASELASKEFPDVDVSIRGAVSIARRLQDPLAELVKIEPKAIGVGQYQHDVNQVKLARALDARVEDCVNAVGVDVNTASAPLLARVAGLSASVAENVVKHRDANGPFPSRKDLLKVPRLGDKAFEQCAGFLRIGDGSNPLDASSVHPEAYPVVERILKQCGREVKQVIGDAASCAASSRSTSPTRSSAYRPYATS